MAQIKTKFITDLAVTNAKIANATIDLTTKVTGVLPVANGGTSLATLTLNNVILGNGTSAPSFVAPSTSGNVLTSNGTTWISAASTALTVLEETITLSGTDITNQYVDLAHTASGASASVNSVQVDIIGGPRQRKTADYTVSLAGGGGGVTRLTFAGDLATGGAAALIAGDFFVAYYSY